MLDSFKAKLAKLLSMEEDISSALGGAPPLALPAYNDRVHKNRPPTDCQISPKGNIAGESTTPSSLTKLVTEECIMHFVQAVSVPPPVIIEESPHPYENNQDYRKMFHINGASRLMIRFDPRCHINTDMLSRVAFYR